MKTAARYMLDTNIVSHVIKATSPHVDEHMRNTPMSSICVSVITEAEMLYGLAKKPEAKGLHEAVIGFLLRVHVLPWDSAASRAFGELRARIEKQGTLLGNLDLLIAANSLAAGTVLVTNDQAFQKINGLNVADWTKPY